MSLCEILSVGGYPMSSCRNSVCRSLPSVLLKFRPFEVTPFQFHVLESLPTGCYPGPHSRKGNCFTGLHWGKKHIIETKYFGFIEVQQLKFIEVQPRSEVGRGKLSHPPPVATPMPPTHTLPNSSRLRSPIIQQLSATELPNITVTSPSCASDEH